MAPSAHKCMACDGKGIIPEKHFRGGYFISSCLCSNCHGSGIVWRDVLERSKEEEA